MRVEEINFLLGHIAGPSTRIDGKTLHVYRHFCPCCEFDGGLKGLKNFIALARKFFCVKQVAMHVTNAPWLREREIRDSDDWQCDTAPVIEGVVWIRDYLE